MSPSERPPLSCGRWQGDGLRLEVRVQVRAARAELDGCVDGRLRLRLTAAPAGGAANEQARRLLAAAFGTGITRVQLVSGAAGRNKSFLIDAPARIPAAVLDHG